ncbi:MAG: tRNA uridine-5-carboxymethylaminomethyl(34) synthesis GTPase MnmE [Pontixanthobacter sp.]
MNTIFALSSGTPPAAIAIVRISGPSAGNALQTLAGSLPAPRRASVRILRDGSGAILDRALALWFPGPNTATGEDCTELHLHGGRAVIGAVSAALESMDGLRQAQPGEFTRRAFANGRIDLAEAEGLADLLTAETELQRQSAQSLASGALSTKVETWRAHVLRLSAMIEATLDFSDEDDVATVPSEVGVDAQALAMELTRWLDRPRAERLKDGFRVVLAGPPNAGKSSLFNAILEDEAAITAPTAGTTRDVLERSVAIEGVAFTFIDTAGLRPDVGGDVEAIGVERARQQIEKGDCVLWLGLEGEGPIDALEIETKADLDASYLKTDGTLRVSSVTGHNIDTLKLALIDRARKSLPKPGEIALNARQSALLSDAKNCLTRLSTTDDLLIIAEELRQTRVAFDALVGRSSTEHMLNVLFGQFCIGK